MSSATKPAPIVRAKDEGEHRWF
ncbi:MAG: hypothetical protein JWM89_3918, partial [Acidimicrobiales bacterium]|nr:hypothetical protein [Acidimicrobiales bacterium]